ncbi:hypothetical protein G9A89_010362 [Geosiphon pyriformis]|nr:hypothetical protein G9A89_010362 [Geosiphon pyriformis]
MTQQPIYQPPIYQSSVYQLQSLIIYQPPQPQIIYQTSIVQTPPSNPAQMTSGNLRSRNYLSLLAISEDTSPNTWKPKQKQSLTNILPATVTKDKFLAAIFPFKIEELTETPLFSGAALEEKPIMVMYMDAKIDVDQAASAKIITTDGATKTPIGEIDNLLIEINGITVLIKVLIMEATQYQVLNTQELQLSQNRQHTHVPVTCGHFKPITMPSAPLIKFEEEKEKPIWKVYQVSWADEDHNKWEEINKGKEKKKEKETTFTNSTYSSYAYTLAPPSNYCQPKLECIDCGKKLSSMGACCGNDKEYSMATRFYYHPCVIEHFGQPKRQEKWNNQPCLVCRTILPDEGMWNDIPGHRRTCDETCQYTILINDWVSKETPINDAWKQALIVYAKAEGMTTKFHEHYQHLAPTREKQEQHLEHNCTLELESTFNPNSNSDNNNDENNSFSFILNSNEIYDNSNFDSNPETFITLLDLTKKQELKWFSDNGKGIMPECTHNTDAGFNLRYPRKDAIKLEPHLHTCINLNIVLKIPATTMFSKKRITIKGGIINARYIENIMAMLQNDSEKIYIIKPNKKIAQVIFLPLVRVAQLVSVGKKEELGITARGIQGFGFMDRIDVPVNMAEEEMIGQGKIISTSQIISIPPYDQYMVIIERKVKDKNQIFEAETSLCESEEIGLINLYIPAKNHNHIKIPIYNTTEDVITILERTIIGYISTELENQPPSIIPDFAQLCEYMDITSQTIYRRNECYLLQSEQLEQINMGNLDLLQHMQLKILLNNFNLR